jgi:pimeloyl-ACP methyl ester carboxylesterase
LETLSHIRNAEKSCLFRESPEGVISFEPAEGEKVMLTGGIILGQRWIEAKRVVVYHQSLNLMTSDGPLVAEFLVPQTLPRALALLIPGLFGIWENFALIIPELINAGFAVVTLDAPGYRNNKTLPLTCGYAEHENVRALCDHCIMLLGSTLPIALFGYSIGATAVLLATMRDSRVKATAVEGAFRTASDGLKFLPNFYRAKLPEFRERYKITNDDVSPLCIAEKWNGAPIMLSWGESDTIVNSKEREILADGFRSRTSSIKLYTVSHAGHIPIIGFPAGEDITLTYIHEVRDFFLSQLNF